LYPKLLQFIDFCVFGVLGYEKHPQVSNGRLAALCCFALKTGTHSA
jgi:hypothetical protein